MSWAKRLPILLFCAVFALGFGAGGIFAGLRPVLQTLAEAWEVRDWQPVPAEVLEAELQQSRGSKGSTTYAVKTRYRYSVGGQSFEGERIGPSDSGGSDNIGDWHERWHERLQQAREGKLRQLAFVDPARPQRAVLERGIRWGLMAFMLPFALLFTTVGLVAAYVFVLTCLGRWSLDESRAKLRMGRRSPWPLALLALYWCGLSLPLTLLVFGTEATWGPRVLISVFALISLGLARAAWVGFLRAEP